MAIWMIAHHWPALFIVKVIISFNLCALKVWKDPDSPTAFLSLMSWDDNVLDWWGLWTLPFWRTESGPYYSYSSPTIVASRHIVIRYLPLSEIFLFHKISYDFKYNRFRVKQDFLYFMICQHHPHQWGGTSSKLKREYFFFSLWKPTRSIDFSTPAFSRSALFEYSGPLHFHQPFKSKEYAEVWLSN